MNSSEFSDLWELMTEYKFQFDTDASYDDIFCIICNNVMIDACQSVCGCRYCHRCIVNYLGDGDRYCPGHKKECKEEYLIMTRDVTRITRMNNKISNLKVKCPMLLCETKIELINMREHLLSCMEHLITCPYVTIGCDDKEDTKEKIERHIHSASLEHSQLLNDWIQSINNEFDKLKQSVNNNESGLLTYKRKFNDSGKLFNIMHKQDSRLKKDIEIVKSDSRIKDVKIREIMTIVMRQNKEIKILQKEFSKSQTHIKTMEEELRKMRNETTVKSNDDAGKRKSKNPRIELDEIRFENPISDGNMPVDDVTLKDEVSVKSELFVDFMENRSTNWINLCFNKDIDYVWKINDLSVKRETMRKKRIFGDSFYSQNYKFCLCLYIDYDDKISLCCYLMKGDNDDNIEWPMKRSVTLSIVDQDSLENYKSATCNYDTYGYDNAFDRPIKDMNDYGIGIWPLVAYSSIVDKPSIIVNDSIVVLCVLNDP